MNGKQEKQKHLLFGKATQGNFQNYISPSMVMLTGKLTAV